MSHAAQVAARNLSVDHMTAEVLRSFGAAGIPSILLKGPSTARWLFTGNPRSYRDCDLLVSPAAMGAAEAVLGGMGFVPDLEVGRMPMWWQEHGVLWRDPKRAAAVDLHRTLTGVGVDDARLWEVLSTETETMAVGGCSATVLSQSGRALHLALHAAQHAGDRGDLERALARAGEETWRGAARLAHKLDATAAFAAGLRFDPRGIVLADEMGLPAEPPLDVLLRSTRAPAQALTFDRIGRASGARERIAIVRHKLVPPPTFMRHWSELARRGRWGLAMAYGQRLVWVARTAPVGWRAWRAWRRARHRTGR